MTESKPIPMTTEEEYRNADVPIPNDLLNASNTEQFKIDKSCRERSIEAILI